MTTYQEYPIEDGKVGRAHTSGPYETFAQIRAGDGNSVSRTFIRMNAYLSNETGAEDGFSYIFRSIVVFDTTTIPATATTSSIVLSLYTPADGKFSGLGEQGIYVVDCTPTNPALLVATDYQATTFTEFASVSFAGITGDAYTNITLPASALTLAGTTSLMLVLEDDYNNALSHELAVGQSGININTTEATSNPPYLTVTYTVPTYDGWYAYIDNTLFEDDHVFNYVVKDRLNQIPIAEFDCFDLTTTDLTHITEDKFVRIFFNDVKRFDGVIKAVDYSEQRQSWHASCEGVASALYDTLIDISSATTDTKYIVDYDSTYDATNNPIYDTMFKYNNTLTAFPSAAHSMSTDHSWDWLILNVPTHFSGPYGFEKSRVLDTISNVANWGGRDWEAYLLYPSGVFVLDVPTRRGTATATLSFVVGEDLFNISRTTDTNKIYNEITVRGTDINNVNIQTTISDFTNSCRLLYDATKNYGDTYLSADFNPTLYTAWGSVGSLKSTAGVGQMNWYNVGLPGQSNYLSLEDGLTGYTSGTGNASTLGWGEWFGLYTPAIPATALIQGIKLEMKRRADKDNNTKDVIIRYTISGYDGQNKADTANYWPITLDFATYGGQYDLWNFGATATAGATSGLDDGINDFNTYLVGIQVNNTVSGTAYIDYLRTTVFYYLNNPPALYPADISGWPNSVNIQIGGANTDTITASRSTTSATYWDIAFPAGTVIHPHSKYDPIYFLSDATAGGGAFSLDSGWTTFPTAAGSVIQIGMEQVVHQGLTANGTLYGWVGGPLTRGYGSTATYQHSSEAPVFDMTYSKSSPATTSSIYNYGVRTKTIYTFGFCNQDQLDHIAYNYLQLTKDPVEYGYAYYCDSDFATIPTIGDQIYIVDADGVSVETRLVGIDYDQHQPVKIYFGMTEDYYLEDYNTSMKSYDIAVTK